MKILFLCICMMSMMSNCFSDSLVNEWGYQFEIGAPGTKSESISGKLLYRENEIPKEFEHVITPIGEFLFCAAKGWSGAQVRWAPFCGGIGITGKEVKSLLSGENSAFRKYIARSQREVETDDAYIAGTYENPPNGIGADWFYVVKQGLWVNPTKLDKVVKLLAINSHSKTN